MERAWNLEKLEISELSRILKCLCLDQSKVINVALSQSNDSFLKTIQQSDWFRACHNKILVQTGVQIQAVIERL